MVFSLKALSLLKSPRLWLIAGFLAYSVGVFYAGKYTAFKETAVAGNTKLLKEVSKRSAVEVKMADESAKKVTSLERDNRELRRLLDDAINESGRDVDCPLSPDEFRLLNEMAGKTTR